MSRDEIDGGWRSVCGLCDTSLRYWWDPNRYEHDEFGDPYRVTRFANVLLVYELARP